MSEEIPDFEEEDNRNGLRVEDILLKYKLPISLLLLGAVLIGFGVFMYKDRGYESTNKIEVVDTTTESQNSSEGVVVEVAGAVKNPGVFNLPNNSRVEDAINRSGGLTDEADLEVMGKVVNRAAKLIDGQKVFIPGKQQSSGGSAKETTGGLSNPDNENLSQILGETGEQNPININSASASQLEALWGIGPVTAQNIIEQRPYSSIEELLTKKILKSNVYERNKNLLTVY